MDIFKSLFQPVNRRNIQFTQTKCRNRISKHISSHKEMDRLWKIRSNKDPIHKGILMIPGKKKRFIKWYFLKIGIEDPSEEYPEGEWGKYKF